MTSRSSTRFRHRMRCSKCRTRFTLKRAPVDTTRCPRCKTDKVFSCEAARRRELAKQVRCRCGVYPFPHRRASFIGCLFHPDRLAGIPLTEEEEEEEQRIDATLARPRTAWDFGCDSPSIGEPPF